MSQDYFAGLQARLQKAAISIQGSAFPNKEPVDLLSGAPSEPLPAPLQPMTDTEKELERLRKFESKFTDLGRAYKAIKSKLTDLEKILSTNTPVKGLSTPQDFNSLEQYLKSCESNNLQNEVTKLTEQLLQIKSSKDEEQQAHAEMYSSVQMRLVEREEEINRLKHRIRKMEGIQTPSDGQMTPSEKPGDQVSLKVATLTQSLKQVTQERDQLLQKMKETDPSYTLKPALSNGSIESIHFSGEIEQLKQELEQQRNSNSYLTELTKSQQQANEQMELKTNLLEKEMQQYKQKTQKQAEQYQTQISDLEEQVKALFEDLAEMSSQNEKMKQDLVQANETNKQLLQGSSANALEQMRQEARERTAGLEFRLGTLQQKLEKAEEDKARVESLLQEAQEQIQSMSRSQSPMNQIPLVDPQELLQHKETIQKLQEEKVQLQEQYGRLQDQLQMLQKQMQETEQRHKQSIHDLMTQQTRLQARVDKKTQDYHTLQSERDSLRLDLEEARKSVENYKQKKEKEIKELKALVPDKETTLKIQSLSEQLEQKNQELKRVKESLDAKNVEIQEYQTRSREGSNERNDLVLEMRQELESAKQTTKEQIQKFLERIKEQAQTIKQLKLEKDQLTQQSESPTAEKQSANQLEQENKILELTETIKTNQLLKDQLEKDLALLTTEHQSTLLLLEQKEQAVKKSHEKQQKLQESVQKLESDLEQSRIQIQQLQQFQDTENHSENDKKVEELKETIEELTLDLNQLKKDNSEIYSLRENIDSLTEDLNSKEEEISVLEKRNEEHLSKIHEQTSKIQELEALKQQLEQRITQVSLESNQDKIQSLEQAVKDRESALSDMSVQLSKAKQQLSEEEEKKAKSIQLLRVSKNRIIKLEGDLNQKLEEIKQLTEQHQKSQKILEKQTDEKQQLVQEQKKLSDLLQSTTDKTKELEFSLLTLRKQLTEEKEQNKHTSALLQDKDERLQVLMAKQSEFTITHQEELSRLKQEHEKLILETRDFPERVKDYDIRIENLEQDLEVSKKLFQTKSIENDQLKLKISELESSLYEYTQKQGKHDLNYNQMQQQHTEQKRISQEQAQEIRTLSKQLESAKKMLSEYMKSHEQHQNDKNLLQQSLDQLKSSTQDMMNKHKEMELQLGTTKLSLVDAEERMKSLQSEKADWVQEKETLLSDFRMRESQLKSLNKSLKEEVRKFTKSASSSVDNSPIMPRASSRRGSQAESIQEQAPPVPPRTVFPPKPMPEPNTDYLRAIILKFIEVKETRAQLIGVIAMLLKFTPEETQRVQKFI